MTKGKSVRRKKNKKKNYTARLAFRVVILFLFFSFGYYFFYKLYFGYQDFDGVSFEKSFEVRGVDLSHHNRIISWDALRRKNISFAYLKATEGISICDEDYRQNYRQAKASNIYVGAYHFFSFNTSGESQADYFIDKAICREGDLLPAIDVEHSPTNRYTANVSKRKKVIEQLKIFERRISDYYGKAPVIYTNKECYELYIKDHFPDNPIWICDLQGKPGKEIDNWVIWQFSHKGKVPGISGKTDLNYYRYSTDRLKNELLM